jgi:MFS transporter, DHA2 family, metal-tetracycline-proton antiporter
MEGKSASLSANDRKLIATLCLLIVFGNINLTMFNLAVPSISLSFALSSSQVSWIMVGYSIVMAVGAGAYSKLAESFSYRRLYTVGIILFAAGSVVGFLAPSYAQVIIGRLIQAAGASAISPLSYGIATRFFDAHIRGRVLGVLSATIAFASGFGPVFGGFIEQYAGWHSLFLVSGTCLFLLPLVLKHIPVTEHRREYFDLPGMVLFSAGMAFLMLGVTINFLLALAGLAALGGFWFSIHKTSHPFISADLLKNTHYRRILWITLITFLCNTGLTFILPIMMKSVFHMATGRIGMMMVPGAVCAGLLGSTLGRWGDRYGSLRILMISQGLVVVGFILLSFSIQFLPLMIAFLIIILMIGFNGMLTSSGKLISLTLEQSELGMGMGVFTLSYLLGGAFGPALIGRLLDLNMPFGVIYIILALIGLLSLGLAFEIIHKARQGIDQNI